jgi:hypothetical protein
MTGYKDKNLANSVKAIKNATSSKNHIYVFDQHPIDHGAEFLNIDDCTYEHKIWDDILGPAAARWRIVYDNAEKYSHVCIISPDITLTPEWDLALIPALENQSIVFSGSGKVSVIQKDLFSIEANYEKSEIFNKSQMVDRNFIFAKSKFFQNSVLPDFLKYAGENEYLSVSFLSRGCDILSVPSGLYFDSNTRSVENTYHTFSLEHKYNLVVDILHGKNLESYKINNQGLDSFLNFHNIASENINRLPYSPDDVAYDPYMLKMHGVDARRFIAGTKAIY